MASKGDSIRELILEGPKARENEHVIPICKCDLYLLHVSRRGQSISALPHEHCSGRVVGTSSSATGGTATQNKNRTPSVTEFAA